MYNPYPKPSSTAFIAIQASASRPAVRSTSTTTATCTRRHALCAAALSLVSGALRPHIASAFGIAQSITPDDFEKVRAAVKDDTSLADFVALMQKGDVKRVWFFGTFKEYCCFEGSDGVLHHIGEGYPVESARSPESPMQVMAKVRNNNVPYYVAPPAAQYLRK